MLKVLEHLGRLIWRQSRDISVLNYPKHFVYEIYTNQGYLRIVQCKETNALQMLPNNQKLQ